MQTENAAMRKQANKNRWDLAFLLGMLVILGIYLYKLPLGTPTADEAFYLTIPQRLLQGDVFFVDEWHGSQLYCLYTAPFLALRNLFTSTGDGVILYWRYCYLAVHSLLCLTMYLRLRKTYRWGAAVGVLILYLFTPYDIHALCYNALGLDMMALTASLAVTAKSKRAWFFAGLAFAAGVLCAPYLVLLYAVGSLTALGYALRKRRREMAGQWLAFTAGCALLALVLFGFTLSRAGLGEVIASIPNLFGDPEHRLVPLWTKLKQIVDAARPWGLPLVEDAAFLLIALLDKDRRKHPLPYIGGMCAMALVMYLHCTQSLLFYWYNYLVVPLAPLGAMAFLLCEKKDWRCFWFFYLGGMGYVFCVHLGSNQMGFILSAMSAVPALAAILLLGELVGELEPTWSAQKGAAICVAAAICLQVGLMTYVKLNHKFWDATPNKDLTVTLDRGPWAGIRVNPAAAESYEGQLTLFENAMAGREPGRILCIGSSPWYYLVDPRMTLGAYSSWLSDTGVPNVDRLCLYYELNPDHLPDYIFVSSEVGWDMWDFQTRIVDAYGFLPAGPDGTLYVRQTPVN